jgi:hypothetical protein
MSNDVESIGIEAVIAEFQVPSWQFCGGTEGNDENINKDSWFLAKIRKRHLTNTNQKYYRFSQLV